MAFGGFFGGSSGKNNSDKSSSSSSSSSLGDAPIAPTSQAVFPPSSIPAGLTSTSSEVKDRLTSAIATQSNIINAKLLISKINENCFDHCVTAPGSSLSGKENQCLSLCMEKYIDAWNTVSKTYVSRLQREGAQLGLGGGAGGL